MMAVLEGLYASGRVADLLVALVALEAVALSWWHRRVGRPGLPWDLLLTLATGAALVMALGAALTDAPWQTVGGWLTAALTGHLADTWLRRPRRATEPDHSGE